MIWRTNGRLAGLIVLQVDDSLGVRTHTFLPEEESRSHIFKRKERKEFEETGQVLNGKTIPKEGSSAIMVHQYLKIARLSPPSTQKAFASQRGLAKYIDVRVRPDVCAALH